MDSLQWAVTASLHVIPLDDLKDHTEDMSCWCNPKTHIEDTSVVIHNSMDRRELYESGELKFN